MKPTLYASRITGTGSAFPKRILTNVELAATVDSSDEWIRERTGIRERRVADPKDPEELNSALGSKAALQALEMAGRRPEDLDMILFATCSPDTLVPSTACWVQHKIGAKNAAAIDLNAACSGYLHALAMADALIRSGQNRCVLVIGAEVLSPFVNWQDRASCILFGDGAGATIVERTDFDHPSRILSSHLGADGSLTDLIICPSGGTKQPVTHELLDLQANKITLKGREVFKVAVKTLADYAVQALEHNGLTIKDLDCFIPHQANLRIIEAVANRLEFPMDRVVVNVDRYGNTSAATIPTALDEAVRTGKVRPGNVVVLDVFGAGLTYGSTCLRW
ncbi:MAG: 3-oxoacyl-[acyl-carrier-protein] synthase 3 [Pseudomonadota bacterium]|jgi:3-oxoacyl-[acyl-carrier-protein] synthase-3